MQYGVQQSCFRPVSSFPRHRMLSQAVEDYIKAIYRIRQSGQPASTSDIARALNVSAASVTNMAKRLAQLGLAEYESYQGVRADGDGKQGGS